VFQMEPFPFKIVFFLFCHNIALIVKNVLFKSEQARGGVN